MTVATVSGRTRNIEPADYDQAVTIFKDKLGGWLIHVYTDSDGTDDYRAASSLSKALSFVFQEVGRVAWTDTRKTYRYGVVLGSRIDEDD